jgi:hypothetical protein
MPEPRSVVSKCASAVVRLLLSALVLACVTGIPVLIWVLVTQLDHTSGLYQFLRVAFGLTVVGLVLWFVWVARWVLLSLAVAGFLVWALFFR